jgi:hypothetical protein
MPEPPRMVPLYAARVADPRFGRSDAVTCRNCGHVAEIAAAILGRSFRRTRSSSIWDTISGASSALVRRRRRCGGRLGITGELRPRYSAARIARRAPNALAASRKWRRIGSSTIWKVNIAAITQAQTAPPLMSAISIGENRAHASPPNKSFGIGRMRLNTKTWTIYRE